MSMTAVPGTGIWQGQQMHMDGVIYAPELEGAVVVVSAAEASGGPLCHTTDRRGYLIRASFGNLLVTDQLGRTTSVISRWLGHRCAPLLPAEVVRQVGLDQISDEGEVLMDYVTGANQAEMESLQCAVEGCNETIVVEKDTLPPGWCSTVHQMGEYIYGPLHVSTNCGRTPHGREIIGWLNPHTHKLAIIIILSSLERKVAKMTTNGHYPGLDDHRERSRAIDNLGRINLIGVAAPLLVIPNARNRIMQLLLNRTVVGTQRPSLMLLAHSDSEEALAHDFSVELEAAYSSLVSEARVVREDGHNEAAGNAISYLRGLDPTARLFAIKRQMLILSRRGGKGKAHFISPFTGGHGTTCATWTRKVTQTPDGKPLKGFVKAAVAVGFCPIECPFCYLQMSYTQSMDIALNLDDLAAELMRWGYKGAKYPYPINFGETSGLVEYDHWFSHADGQGSIVQQVIDACYEARVMPFFLSKQAYPDYLKYKGLVQVGISLSPEPVRQWLSPYGSPASTLLQSLRRAVDNGAVSPVIRLALIWEQRECYPQLLDEIAQVFGDYRVSGGLRITADLIRFTPSTAAEIGRNQPVSVSRRLFDEAAVPYTETADAQGREYLKVDTAAATDAKFRAATSRQNEVYRWLRGELNARGLQHFDLTPCKGNPTELLQLVREGTLEAMPCACYAASPVQRQLEIWQKSGNLPLNQRSLIPLTLVTRPD